MRRRRGCDEGWGDDGPWMDDARTGEAYDEEQAGLDRIPLSLRVVLTPYSVQQCDVELLFVIHDSQEFRVVLVVPLG